jgi:predicted Zn-dependent peptidase
MEVTKQIHANGLRSIVVNAPEAQSATVMFLVAVGSRFETPDQAGLAHFVEHTLFKGTKLRPNSKAISMEMESLGGSSNAFTSYDYTGYYIKAPEVNFEKSFEILADMFKNSLFSEEEIEKERGVIVEEIRMYEDRPTSKVSQTWLANHFLGNSLAEEITGSIESVKAMKRQQFFDFLKDNYYAENVLVVASGKVDEARITRMIEQHCLDIPSLAGRPKSSFELFTYAANPARKTEIFINKDVEQTHVVLGGPSIHRDDPRRYALQVANTVLSGGFGSRLFQVIRDELGLAYYVYSRLMSFQETGVFQIGMGVDSTRRDEAIKAAKQEVLKIVEGQFTQAEFERARNYLLGNLVTELETSDDLASFYGMQELLQTSKFTIAEVKEKILAVTLNDIREVTQEVFNPDNFTLAVISK